MALFGIQSPGRERPGVPRVDWKASGLALSSHPCHWLSLCPSRGWCAHLRLYHLHWSSRTSMLQTQGAFLQPVLPRLPQACCHVQVVVSEDISALSTCWTGTRCVWGTHSLSNKPGPHCALPSLWWAHRWCPTSCSATDKSLNQPNPHAWRSFPQQDLGTSPSRFPKDPWVIHHLPACSPNNSTCQAVERRLGPAPGAMSGD